MKLPSIDLGKETLSDFEESIGKEWIITNGLGGYASSTILGINTRKYHGLLVAALCPPRDRRVCLAKLDEEISVGNKTYSLGANEYQSRIFPLGYMFLDKVTVSPFPRYTYIVQGIEIQKTIFMPHEKNAVVTIYNILNKGSDIQFRVFPLVNWRHFHSVTNRWRIPWRFVQKKGEKEVGVRLGPSQSMLVMTTTSGRYLAREKWIEKIYYRKEAMREESCLDDCFQLGCFETNITANKSEKLAVIALASRNEDLAQRILAEMPRTMYDVEAIYGKERERLRKVLTKFYEEHKSIQVKDWLNWIVLATTMFIVKEANAGLKSMIAGYHWFEDWGRDAFISLPGLMLVLERFDDARKVFLVFKNYCEKGLIPNFLPDQAGKTAYNSVDATLWYVNAVLQYLKYTGDFRFVHENLWETLKMILENHLRGTLFNIHVDTDGLLSHGPQLTWMDTVTDGEVITPRVGKAVEVQALWFNALKIMEILADTFKEKEEAEKYARMAEEAKRSFVKKFWNTARNCLFDVIEERGKDVSLRPNQIIAVALNFSMLDHAKSEKIVEAVRRGLLTPYGLRTLAKDDPRYIGVYAGNRRSRDEAYHNGTVWPWLLGPFATAFLKMKGHAEYRREFILNKILLPLFSQKMFEAGLGTVSEIFDGEPPQTSRGCIAQAWSIAEPFRAYVEDVMQVRPRHERKILQGSS